MEKVFRRQGNRLVRIPNRDPLKLYTFTTDEAGDPCYIELSASEEAGRVQDRIRHQDSIANPVFIPTINDKLNFLMDKFYISEEEIVEFIKRRPARTSAGLNRPRREDI